MKETLKKLKELTEQLSKIFDERIRLLRALGQEQTNDANHNSIRN